MPDWSQVKAYQIFFNRLEMRALQRRIFKIKVILKELLLQVLILLQLKFKLMLWPRYSSQTYETLTQKI